MTDTSDITVPGLLLLLTLRPYDGIEMSTLLLLLLLFQMAQGVKNQRAKNVRLKGQRSVWSRNKLEESLEVQLKVEITKGLIDENWVVMLDDNKQSLKQESSFANISSRRTQPLTQFTEKMNPDKANRLRVSNAIGWKRRRSGRQEYLASLPRVGSRAVRIGPTPFSDQRL